MNANPLSILYYYHPDRVGTPAELPDQPLVHKRSSRFWKLMDWIAETMILAGAQLHRACRSHTRVEPMRQNMSDNLVPLE